VRAGGRCIRVMAPPLYPLRMTHSGCAIVGRRQGIPLRPPPLPHTRPAPGAPAARDDRLLLLSRERRRFKLTETRVVSLKSNDAGTRGREGKTPSFLRALRGIYRTCIALVLLPCPTPRHPDRGTATVPPPRPRACPAPPGRARDRSRLSRDSRSPRFRRHVLRCGSRIRTARASR
jgi:hypothetical protein